MPCPNRENSFLDVMVALTKRCLVFALVAMVATLAAAQVQQSEGDKTPVAFTNTVHWNLRALVGASCKPGEACACGTQ
eukprot:10614-Eustigmatos_ZCMA.PRE.1